MSTRNDTGLHSPVLLVFTHQETTGRPTRDRVNHGQLQIVAEVDFEFVQRILEML